MVSVKISAGGLEGTRLVEPRSGRSVDRYAGIPYAEAPVGPRRFAAPVEITSWDGVRSALEFGPSAPQLTVGPFVDIVPGNRVGAQSEDCLSLNVWTPAGAGPGDGLPVLVWIHGGAFVIGGSSLETYDGTRLAAAHDVVVVSLNYRLGALGFLALPAPVAARLGASPNCGLLDQVAALRWVQRHIGDLGGDAGRVTIFGESAGAGSILHLLATPAARGLYRRAIMQSPGVATVDRAAAEGLAAAVLRHLDIAHGEEERLLEVPVDALLNAQQAAADEMAPGMGAMPWHPVVDGEVIPVEPLAAFAAGAIDDVDVILGTTAEEMRLFADPSYAELPPEMLAGLVQAVVTPLLHGDPGQAALVPFVAAYQQRLAAGDGESAGGDLFTTILTDVMMRIPALHGTDVLAGRGGPGATYAYSFEWPAPRVGACHGLDMPFTFGTLGRCGWDAFTGADTDPRAVQLSDDLMAAWAAFAATGDPAAAGTGGLAPWPQYDQTARLTKIIGPAYDVREHPTAPRLSDYAPVEAAAAR